MEPEKILTIGRVYLSRDNENNLVCPSINTDYYGCFKNLKRRQVRPTAIVIHHTATTKPKRTRESLIKKGYSTHFEVDRDGTIYQYADVMTVCSHCGSANIHTIGIDVTHKSGDEFTEDQIYAVKNLVKWLCNVYGIPQIVHNQLSGIYPHKALGNTVCPEDFPMDKLNQ